MYHPRLKGSHYDIGLRFGKLLKRQNENFEEIIQLSAFQNDFGKKSQSILAEVFPEVCDEIRGLTDGLHFSYERFASWLLCMGCCLHDAGCTVFCFTHNNTVLYGRNNDLPPILKRVSKSALYVLDNGYSFLGNTSAMINFEEGVNENGLTAAMTFVFPTNIEPGLSSVFLVRYLLEKCATTHEAIRALQHLPIASACNILLADKKGDMVVAECIPDKIFLRNPAKDETFLVIVNDFSSDEIRTYAAPTRDNYFAETRYNTAYNALKTIDYTDGIEHAKDILSGKHGFMCQYDKVLDFDTIWSSIFDISNNRIYRAEGNPSRATYKEDIRFKAIVKDTEAPKHH